MLSGMVPPGETVPSGETVPPGGTVPPGETVPPVENVLERNGPSDQHVVGVKEGRKEWMDSFYIFSLKAEECCSSGCGTDAGVSACCSVVTH